MRKPHVWPMRTGREHPGMHGVDIDAVHITWPHQRGLFRRQRRPWVPRLAIITISVAAGYLLRHFTGA